MYSSSKKSIALNKGQEGRIIAQMQPAFTLKKPARQTSPLIFASPHSGATYPKDWVEATRLSERELRQVEDAFIDSLFASALTYGAPLLSANFPRSYVDVNRSIDELPINWIEGDWVEGDWVEADAPETGKIKQNACVPSPRAAAGLGVIPTAIGENAHIYDAPLSRQASTQRLSLYQLYHDQLAQLISQTKSQFGYAILIDCHSMPGFSPSGARYSDFILGDRYGKSCDPAVIDCISAQLKSSGYRVTRNYPYAGGYVTRHYGQPDAQVHALQIEINRELYLNKISMQKNHGFDKLEQNIDDLIKILTAHHSAHLERAAE